MRNSYRFTIVELIVVISIIAILASLLLPALKQARDKAKQIGCVGNLKQLGVLTLGYIDDNDGYFPGRINAAAPYFDQMEPYTNIPRGTGEAPGEYSKAGIYFCPGDYYRAKWGCANRSYGQNNYLRGDLETESSHYMARIQTIRNSSKYIYRIDCKREVAGAEGWPVMFSMNAFPFKGDVVESDTGVDFRHHGQANSLFADFHVEPKTYHDLFGSWIKYIIE